MDFRNAHLFIDLQFATGSFLPFHNIHGVLKARMLKLSVILFSTGPFFVKNLLHLFFNKELVSTTNSSGFLLV